MSRLHRFLLPAMAAGLAFADGSISGPVAGYVTNSSQAQLRTIFGVPGALTFSEPLPLPEGVTHVRLAPGQDFALAERANSAPGVLFLKAGAVDRLAPIDAAMPSADWIAFSPAAGSALLFSAAAHRLQLLNGLPDAPQVALDLDAATLPEQPTMGAVSDDGSLVLVASAASVYRLSRDGAAQMVLSAGAIQSLTVLRNGVDAAVSDNTAGSVQLVRNAASHPEARVLASGLDGIGTIFPSWDGQSLFVARPGAEAISSIDLATGEVRSFPSSVAAAGLIPLRNRDTFLISAEAHKPGWVFYRDGSDARVVFIPAAAPAVLPPVTRRGGVR
ncbi:MAG TPA: hypothetical protein VGZ73_30050 [Bryobacteraceae bacterium]|nr:hypothetical protein [Bryobacteraceae bacterium]